MCAHKHACLEFSKTEMLFLVLVVVQKYSQQLKQQKSERKRKEEKRRGANAADVVSECVDVSVCCKMLLLSVLMVLTELKSLHFTLLQCTEIHFSLLPCY